MIIISKTYTLTQVKSILNISNATIYRLIKHGKLKAEKHGRSYQIEQSEVDYLKQHYRNQKNPQAKSSREVCDELDISIQQLYNIVHRHEIEHYNIIRQNYSYFEPAAIQKIKYYANQYSFKHRGKHGVNRPEFKPNTDQLYNAEIDCSPFALCAQFRPRINSNTMNNWLKYRQVSYSVDTNHRVFFNPQQVRELKNRYKKYPNEKLYNSHEMADILNLKRMDFQRLCIKNRINGLKILGDKNYYYTEDQLTDLSNLIKNKK